MVRQGLGFYTALAATGIYELGESASRGDNKGDERFVEILSGPLAECIEQHPILSTLIDGIDTESPSFRKASEIDLTNHIKTLQLDDIHEHFSEQNGTLENSDTERDSLVGRTLEVIHNQPFEDTSIISPWKVYVLSIPAENQLSEPGRKSDQTGEQVLIAFAYSHAIGDGASGLAFHRTLINALNNHDNKSNGTLTNPVASTKCKASSDPLPPAIDSPTQLPISWTYFLSAIIDAFIPKAILSRFLQQSPQDTNTKTWTGSPVFFTDTNNETRTTTKTTKTGAIAKSATHHFTISPDILSATLSQCRTNNAKLSSLLHQIIVNALHHELWNQGIETNTFSSSTSTDLRRAYIYTYGKSTKYTPDQMGVMASAVKQTHRPLPIPTLNNTSSSKNQVINDEFWTTASQTTNLLAKGATTLQDQQIGLLKYISSLRSWHTGKIGKEREISYELSNVMSMNVDVVSPGIAQSQQQQQQQQQPKTKLKKLSKMIFSQPADVTGPAMSVNVVSVRGGELSMVLSWQVGALGLDSNSNLNSNLDKPTDQAVRSNMNLVFDRERLERAFVARVAKHIKHGMQTVADIGQKHTLP